MCFGFYLKGRFTDILSPLVCPPNGCNGKVQANPELGARNFIPVSHMSTGPKDLSLPLLLSQMY